MSLGVVQELRKPRDFSNVQAFPHPAYNAAKAACFCSKTRHEPSAARFRWRNGGAIRSADAKPELVSSASGQNHVCHKENT